MAAIRALNCCSSISKGLVNKILVRQLTATAALARSAKVNLFDLNFDRRIKIDYKDSVDYMESEAYKKTYQGNMVWKLYRRNHKAAIPRDQTRPNCINADGFVDTSYPCPICRDEYLVLHPENVKLLKQFIDEYTGQIVRPREHGLCQKQYRNLIVAITQAKDIGFITYDVPDRLYNYEEYYNH